MTTENQTAKNNLRRPNLKQETAQFIRDLILSGEVKPGERLDQDSIADSLGVSRLPVREALIALEADGLVENIARRGSFVADLQPEDFVDHYRMYGLISGVAVARAATASDPEVIAQLEDITEKMHHTTDPREHDALNFRFHQIINKAGSTRRLRAVLRMLSNSMPTHFFEYNSEWEFKKQALAEHDEIIKAIKDKDPEAASKAMENHFINNGNQTVKMLQSVNFWD